MRRKPVVLYIEDDLQISQVIVLLLGMEGVEVIYASSGLEGVRKCKIHKPHLIITDLKMPDMDGFETIRRLRAEGDCSHIPIIAFTGYAQELATEAMQAGATGVLSKTEGFDLLLNMVNGLLQSSESSNK